MSDQVTVKFCPQCGSARVDFSELVGSEASCKGCGWKGSNEALLVVRGAAAALQGDKTAEFVNDLRQMLSGELGVVMLRFLLKWGFLKADTNNLAQTLDRKEFARYLMRICKAVADALIEERIEQEINGVREQGRPS